MLPIVNKINQPSPPNSPVLRSRGVPSPNSPLQIENVSVANEIIETSISRSFNLNRTVSNASSTPSMSNSTAPFIRQDHPEPGITRRVVSALRAALSGALEIQCKYGTRISSELITQPLSAVTPPQQREISLPPIQTALPQESTASATTFASTSTLPTTATTLPPSTLSTTAIANQSTTAIQTQPTSSFHTSSQVSPLTPNAQIGSQGASYSTWAASGLHMEIESRGLTFQPPVSELALHSEVGVGNGDGSVSTSLAVRTGISSNRGVRAGRLSFMSEQEVRLHGGGGIGGALLNSIAPTEGVFSNTEHGFGVGAGARVRVQHHWNLDSSQGSAVRFGVASTLLMGAHVTGGVIGGAIGSSLLLQDHGTAVGAGILVGAATTILNCIPALRANERVYVRDAFDVAAADVTLRFASPIPSVTTGQNFMDVVVRPRVRLNFESRIDLSQERTLLNEGTELIPF